MWRSMPYIFYPPAQVYSKLLFSRVWQRKIKNIKILRFRTNTKRFAFSLMPDGHICLLVMQYHIWGNRYFTTTCSFTFWTKTAITAQNVYTVEVSKLKASLFGQFPAQVDKMSPITQCLQQTTFENWNLHLLYIYTHNVL